MKYLRIIYLFLAILVAKYSTAATPTWAVNPASYQYSMTVTAIANVNCTMLAGPSNIIGAFVGGTCRGVAYTNTFIGGYYTASLVVYSDVTSGETVTYKVYNVDADSVFEALTTTAFQDNANYGSSGNPFTLLTNNQPSSLSLSANTVNSGVALGTAIGNFSTSDADAGQTFTYSLVSGLGSTNNANFSIVGGQLRTAATMAYSVLNSHQIRVRTTDNFGCFMEQNFTVSVNFVNSAPYQLNITDSAIIENSAAFTIIGTLSALDIDTGETHTFSLVSGVGDTNNAVFNISGSTLRSASQFNYEVKNSYSVRIRVTDKANNSFERILRISVTNTNDAPSNILIDNNATGASFAENRFAGSLIGLLSSTDEDASNTFTYSFVTVTGNDNSSFQIVNNQLRTAANFDYETRQNYSIYIQTNDGNGGIFSKQFLLTVTDSNDAPIGLALSGTSVYENQVVRTFISRLSTTDPDVNQSAFTYALVVGSGSTNNANFLISNDSLYSNATFNFETASTQSIRIRSTDPAGAFTSQSFIITIVDANDAPTDINISSSQIAENQVANSVVGAFSSSDQDANNTFIYSLVSGVGSTDNSLFNISGSNLRTSASFDFETKNSYSIRVRTNDGNNGTYEKIIIISITDYNDSPTNVFLSSGNITENRAINSPIGTLSTTDQDVANSFTYSFSDISGNDNSSFVITGSTLRSAVTFNYEAKNLYFVYITSNDGNGGTFTKQFQINIADSNDSPIAISIGNSSINEGMAIPALVGKLSTTDPDASNTSFIYSLVSGTGSTGNSNFLIRNDSLFANAIFNFETNSSYSVRVRTNDGYNGLLDQVFTISVLDANDAPTDISLSSSEVLENQLSGTTVGSLISTDADNNSSHSYTLVSGVGSTDNAFFSIVGSNLKTASSFDYEVKSSYAVRIKTSDGNGGFFEKAFVITVTNANDVPSNITLSNSSIPENRANNSLVGLLNTTDQDVGNAFTYSFVTTTGSDNASFVLSGNQLRTAALFNYEAKSNFYVYIQTNDGNGGTYTKQFLVSITDSNDAPTDISLSSPSITENKPANSFIGQLSTFDADASDNFSYALVSGLGSADNSSFIVRNDSLFSALPLDFELKNTYYIRLKTTDNGSLSFQKAFVINVVNDNDAPSDLALSANYINENAAINTLLGTLSTSDADTGNTFSYSLVPGVGSTNNNLFTISGNQLKSAAQFNYELARTFSIRVQTSDGNGGTFSKAISISVLNMNDAPTQIALSLASISENRAVGSTIGILSTSDEDSASTHSYSLVSNQPNDNTSFVIQGNLLKSNAIFNYESKSTYLVNVQTNDGNGGTFDRVFLINIIDSNDAPTNLNVSNLVVDENEAALSYIGTLSAEDPDALSTSTFSLATGIGATDNNSFVVRNDSLLTNQTFDYETKNVYSIRLRAIDNGGLAFEKQVSISVRNKNDQPIDLTINNTNVNENSVIGTLVGNLSTLDPDSGNTFSYSLVSGLGSTDNTSFTIVGNELRSFAVFNFETKRLYSVRIQTNDGKGGTFSKAYGIYINNVNDVPTNVSLSALTLKENRPINSFIATISTSDEDTANTFSYSFSTAQTNDNGSFIINGNQLSSNSVFNYESKNVYVIGIKTNDGNGGIFEKQFVLNILDSNDVPVNIALNNNTMNENEAPNSFIGILSTEDPDAIDNFVYTLSSGNGSTDNSSFTIRYDSLFSNSSFNYENKAAYSIRVRSTDLGSLKFDKVLSISVNDDNDAPTDILLSTTSFSENLPSKTSIARISSLDADAVNSFSYDLVSGVGAADNASFSIAGDELKTNSSFNFELKSVYQIRLRCSDGRGGVYEEAFTINVSDSNDVPSDISLSTNNVTENRKIGSLVAYLSTVDQDAGDIHSNSFSNVPNSNNSSFMIINNELRTSTVFDFETKSFYLVYITSTDSKGSTFTKQFLINVVDSVDAPTELNLSNSIVTENKPASTFIGLLTTADADQLSGFTYSFVGGLGASDNNSFAISNDSLYTLAPLNFELKNLYSIRIRTTDATSAFFEHAFQVTISDANDAPTDIDLSNTLLSENAPVGSLVGAMSSKDEDPNSVFTYSLVSGTGSTDNSLFDIQGNQLTANFSANYELKSTYSIRVQTKDGSNDTYEKELIVSIINKNEEPTLKMDTFYISEDAINGSIIGICGASDPDAAQNTTYKFSELNSFGSLFKLNTNGELSLNGGLDYETNKSYELSIIVTDDGSPEKSDTGIVIVRVKDIIEAEKELSVINYMSPNGDGVNDFFVIPNVELYKDYSLTIYNENGLVVYKVFKEYANNWDGTYNGNLLPTGVYYYVLSNSTQNTDFKGSITIIKP